VMRLAFIAPLSPQAFLSPDRLKKGYRQRYLHPAPWAQVISEAIAALPDVKVCVSSHARGVRQKQVVSLNKVDYCFVPKHEPGHLDSLQGHLTARIQLGAAIREWGADLVQGFGTEGYCGWTAATSPLPSVIQMQGIVTLLHPYMRLGSLDRRMRIFYEQKMVRRADVVLAATEFVRDWVHQIDPEKTVHIIPHGVRQDFFDVEAPFESSRFLCVSSFWGYKGIDTVIRALHFLTTDLKQDASLTLIGGGPLQKELEGLVREFGLQGRVQFAGRVPDRQVREEMTGAIASLIGSRMDSSPNVVSEAHAAGLPVIGTRAGGIPDMIEQGRDGFLVGMDDYKEMAIRMKQILEDRAGAKKMGACGRAKVCELNNPARIAEKHLAVYREMLSCANR